MKKLLKGLLIALIVFAVIMLGVLVAVPFITTGDMLNFHGAYDYINPADYDVTSEQIILQTDDDVMISTYFVEADNPKGAIVLVSGIHNPPVCTFYDYAKIFEDRGFSTLLVEMRSHGESEATGISGGVNEWLDVKAGVDYLCSQDKYKDLPKIAYGTSMGASTVIIAAGQVKEIDAVISASAYSKWSDVAYYSMVEQMDIPEAYAKVQKPFFDLNLGLKYGLGKMKYTPIRQIKNIDVPTLLMHSEGDTQVPYSCYERLHDNFSDINNLYLYTLEGDYHFVCTEDDPEEDERFVNAVSLFLEKVVSN